MQVLQLSCKVKDVFCAADVPSGHGGMVGERGGGGWFDRTPGPGQTVQANVEERASSNGLAPPASLNGFLRDVVMTTYPFRDMICPARLPQCRQCDSADIYSKERDLTRGPCPAALLLCDRHRSEPIICQLAAKVGAVARPEQLSLGNQTFSLRQFSAHLGWLFSAEFW